MSFLVSRWRSPNGEPFVLEREAAYVTDYERIVHQQGCVWVIQMSTSFIFLHQRFIWDLVPFSWYLRIGDPYARQFVAPLLNAPLGHQRDRRYFGLKRVKKVSSIYVIISSQRQTGTPDHILNRSDSLRPHRYPPLVSFKFSLATVTQVFKKYVVELLTLRSHIGNLCSERAAAFLLDPFPGLS